MRGEQDGRIFNDIQERWDTDVAREGDGDKHDNRITNTRTAVGSHCRRYRVHDDGHPDKKEQNHLGEDVKHAKV